MVNGRFFLGQPDMGAIALHLVIKIGLGLRLFMLHWRIALFRVSLVAVLFGGLSACVSDDSQANQLHLPDRLPNLLAMARDAQPAVTQGIDRC